MKDTWLSVEAKDRGGREGLSIMMEIFCSVQVIKFLFPKDLKDLKFPPEMRFCKSRSQTGHPVVRPLQCHDQLLLFPSPHERQPPNGQPGWKSGASYAGSFVLVTVAFV